MLLNPTWKKEDNIRELYEMTGAREGTKTHVPVIKSILKNRGCCSNIILYPLSTCTVNGLAPQ